MRAAVVTNGNYFAAVVLAPFLERCTSDSVVIVTRGRGTQTSRSIGIRLMRSWGLRLTTFKVFTGVILPLLGRVLRRPWSVASTARRIPIQVVVIDDVNGREGVEFIRSLSPDVLVSVSCPYIIRDEVLELAPLAVNVHSSLLPRFAGVATYIHALAEGEERVGVTLHRMVPRVDAGEILFQRSLQVGHRESAFSVFQRQCRTGSELLVELVESDEEVRGRRQDLDRRSYYGEPTKEDVRRMTKRGHPLFAPRDVATVWRFDG